MEKQKKVILRKCIASQQMMPKEQLLRIVKLTSGELTIDMTGKINGRGAYISPNLSAYEMVKKNKSLEKSLKVKVSDEFYQKLYYKIINKEE